MAINASYGRDPVAVGEAAHRSPLYGSVEQWRMNLPGLVYHSIIFLRKLSKSDKRTKELSYNTIELSYCFISSGE